MYMPRELTNTTIVRYGRIFTTAFYGWTFLLATLIVLVIAQNFSPAVYETVHISLIISNTNQLINTLQFLFAFEFFQSIELLMMAGTGRLAEAQKKNNKSESEPESSDYISDADSSYQESEMDRRIRIMHGKESTGRPTLEGSDTDKQVSSGRPTLEGSDMYKPREMTEEERLEILRAPKWQKERTDGLAPGDFNQFQEKLTSTVSTKTKKTIKKMQKEGK